MSANESLQSEEASHLDDDSCGIAESLNRFPAIAYILKQQASDFVVNEIDMDGNLVVFDENERFVAPTSNDEPVADSGLDPATELRRVFGEHVAKEVAVFYESAAVDQLILECGFASKEERTRMHHLIKTLFKNDLLSDTVEGGKVRLTRSTASSKCDRRNSQRQVAKFLRFVMKKENVDTIDAVHTIARRLRMPPKSFSYAGSKDKRACTTQAVVVRNCDPAKLAGFNTIPRTGIKIGGIQETGRALQLGDLRGNRFAVTLHSVDPFDLAGRIEAMKQSGFINYFGRQRFGSSSVKSHTIGLALLREDWAEATRLLLAPRPGEHGPVQAARIHWMNTCSAAEARELFPSWCTAERQILHHLSTAPTDYRGAIGSINRELRLIYVHAVQSFIWNQMASDLVATHMPEDWPESLPIIGYETVRPEHHPHLVRLGLNPSSAFRSTPQSEKLWDLPGTTRALICRATDLEGEQLVDRRMVRVSFSLPTSAYATMLLRELMGN